MDTQSQPPKIATFGALKAAGFSPRSIKDEMRDNLIAKLKAGEDVFPGVYGYGDTVIPDIQRAILSRHNFILLRLRGQAKTRIARQMVSLLDEWIPVVAGSELNDDPFGPLSRGAVDLMAEMGDATPITWLHRSERYGEKLATPDVSLADLIGDLDPIKAANLRLSYADEKVIHFGLIPRSNRSIFVINELPDLQARIQVALFNILQEGDVQIRGFKLRMPLDMAFVFTANPEDYTNRGSIVTPLKDRIESQILTHYPKSLEISRKITEQEALISKDAAKRVTLNPIAANLIEQVAIEARQSEYVDQKSGVSARLTITALENLVSAAELRALQQGLAHTQIRLTDFWGVVPAITGKIELVYEGEQEGPAIVAHNLIGKAMRAQFLEYFPNPEELRKNQKENPYETVIRYFGGGKKLDLLLNLSEAEYESALKGVPGLEGVMDKFQPEAAASSKLFFMQFVLNGLSEFSLIGKSRLERGIVFQDLMSGLFSGSFGEDEEEY